MAEAGQAAQAAEAAEAALHATLPLNHDSNDNGDGDGDGDTIMEESNSLNPAAASSSSAASTAASSQPVEEDSNNSLCQLCAQPGILLCCESCPYAFHLDCLGLDSMPQGVWQCRLCVKRAGRSTSTAATGAGDAVARVGALMPVPLVVSGLAAGDVTPAAAAAAVATSDVNLSVCYACGHAGTLVCCDTCPAAYHERCLDVEGVPDGLWQCPICVGEATHEGMRRQRERSRLLTTQRLLEREHERQAEADERSRLRAKRRRQHQMRVCALCKVAEDELPVMQSSSALPEDNLPRSALVAEAQLGEPLLPYARVPTEDEVSPDPLPQPREFVGPFHDPQRQEDVYVHVLCALWSPKVYTPKSDFSNGLDVRNFRHVIDEVDRGRWIRCVGCGKNGATIGCFLKECPQSYHYRCALQAGCHMDRRKFRIRCPDHSIRHRLRQANDDSDSGVGEYLALLRRAPRRQDGGDSRKRKQMREVLANRRRVHELLPHVDEVPVGESGSQRARTDAYLAAIGRTITNAQDVWKVELARQPPPKLPKLTAPKRSRKRRKERHGRASKHQWRLRREVRSMSSEAVSDMVQATGVELAHAKSEDPWATVGGLDGTIQQLKESVLLPVLYPEIFGYLSIQPPRGCILYGPPGTGKTLLARALARACSPEVTLFCRKGPDILSKFYGDSEAKLRLLFAEAAKKAPSIILFDEMDGLAPARNSRHNQVYSSIVTTLLALMDGLDARGRVFVLATTNRLSDIDPALRRPGRFDREVRVGLPTRAARREIFRVHTRGWKWEEEHGVNEMLDAVADRAVGLSGAQIRALCAEAALEALRRSLDAQAVSIFDFFAAAQKLELNMHLPSSRLGLRGLRAHLAALASGDPSSALPSAPFAQQVSAALQSLQATKRLIVSCSALDKLTSFMHELLSSRDLEHMEVHTLGLPHLLAASERPEAICTRAFCEARASREGLVLLPRLDEWWAHAGGALRLTLESCLAEPVLVVASSVRPWSASTAFDLGMNARVFRTFAVGAMALSENVVLS